MPFGQTIRNLRGPGRLTCIDASHSNVLADKNALVVRGFQILLRVYSLTCQSQDSRLRPKPSHCTYPSEARTWRPRTARAVPPEYEEQTARINSQMGWSGGLPLSAMLVAGPPPHMPIDSGFTSPTRKKDTHGAAPRLFVTLIGSRYAGWKEGLLGTTVNVCAAPRP